MTQVQIMTVVHTYFYIVVDTQRGCHTLKLNYIYIKDIPGELACS